MVEVGRDDPRVAVRDSRLMRLPSSQRRKGRRVSAAHGSRRTVDATPPGPSAKAPYWVRLVRSGTTVTAYVFVERHELDDPRQRHDCAGRECVRGNCHDQPQCVVHHDRGGLARHLEQFERRLGASVGPSLGPERRRRRESGGEGIRIVLERALTRSRRAATDIWETSGSVQLRVPAGHWRCRCDGTCGVADEHRRLGKGGRHGPRVAQRRCGARLDVHHARHRAMRSSAARPRAACRTTQVVGRAPHPGWVRVKRAGSLFTAYKSTDGQSWTVVGSDSITMGTTVFVGIAVTSHNPSSATRATVTNFAVTASGTTNQRRPS